MAFDPKPTIRITKLNAARRQLQTAIELWFNDADPVSIHTLAFAAHEIIHRLFKRKGLKDLMFDSSQIREEQRGEFARMIKEDAAFFKHADTDPNATRDFNPLANDLFMSMSVVGLLRMKEDMHEMELAFNFWNVIHNPHWFPEDIVENHMPISDLKKLQSLGKLEFLHAFLARRRG